MDINSSRQWIKLNTQALVILAGVILLCCLVGILGRPLSYLAILWPANAVLLGMFLRFPQFNNLGGWLGAFLGYMVADLITGNTFFLTLCLTLANLLNPLTTLILLKIFGLHYKQYNKGLTFLFLFLISAFGGCLASPVFAVLTIPYLENTFMDVDRQWIDFGMWWTGEILNLVAFLPIVLAIPDLKDIKLYLTDKKHQALSLKYSFPLIAVILSVALTHFFIGPGAIMFPIAALIWAALSYNLFFVTIINCFVAMFMYNSISTYYLAESPDAYFATTLSVRIGLFMLALGPLTLSIISLNRQQLYHRILYLANYDGLTTTMNRRFFYEESERTVKENSTHPTDQSVTLLLMDLDHFKKINDRYGHEAGDRVLQEFSRIVKSRIQPSDLFGRIGGEEFAVLLKNKSLEQSIQTAQAICDAIHQTPVILNSGYQLNISVSIGLSYQHLPYCTPFQQLINRADSALYTAKTQGRNRLCVEQHLQQRPMH